MVGQQKRISVDVGGTFTDAVMVDDQTGEINVWKVPSTPDDRSIGVMKSIEKAGGLIGQAKSMIHGTTVGENTLIQRSGPKIGLIATKGQRDRIEIQRCNLLWSFDFY